MRRVELREQRVPVPTQQEGLLPLENVGVFGGTEVGLDGDDLGFQVLEHRGIGAGGARWSGKAPGEARAIRLRSAWTLARSLPSDCSRSRTRFLTRPSAGVERGEVRAGAAEDLCGMVPFVLGGGEQALKGEVELGGQAGRGRRARRCRRTLDSTGLDCD